MSEPQPTIKITSGEVIVHADGSVSETHETQETAVNLWLESLQQFLTAMEKFAKEGEI